MTTQPWRKIEHAVSGLPTSDGAGVRLTRYLHGPDLQQRLDPYLMLDAFGSDKPDEYIAGFPDHPHRGFETITYMLEGRMLHRDSAGNEGLLNSGDVQWMCAGKGVIHSEMPQQVAGRMEGFQLWLNLPAAEKMCEPWYQDLDGDSVPRLETASGSQIMIIAGYSHGIAGSIQRPRTEPLYLDVQQPAGSSEQHQIPSGHNAFILLYQGSITVSGQSSTAPCMLILDNTPGSHGVQISAQENSRYLLVAGKPLAEPIEQHGPFVMNSKEQIYRAIQDYRNGNFG